MTSLLDDMSKYGLSYMKTNGGLSIWVKLPESMDSIDLYKECRANNLAIVPGKVFFTDKSIYSNYIRLSFGSVDKDQINEGMRILESIIAKPFKDKNSDYMPFI